MCGNVEHGVVAEAVVATWREEDAAFPCALADEGRGIVRVPQVNHQALKAGRSLLFGNAGERGQQLPVVLPVTAGGAGEARRTYARSTIEVIDLDAGVVGNCGKSAAVGCVARFDYGVFDERQSGLIRFRNIQAVLRNNLDLLQ